MLVVLSSFREIIYSCFIIDFRIELYMFILSLFVRIMLNFLSSMEICFLPGWVALTQEASGFTSIIPWTGVVFSFSRILHYAPWFHSRSKKIDNISYLNYIQVIPLFLLRMYIREQIGILIFNKILAFTTVILPWTNNN